MNLAKKIALLGLTLVFLVAARGRPPARPAVVVPEDPEQTFLAEFARGERYYNDLDYERAAAILAPALAQAEKLPAEAQARVARQVADGHRYLAYSFVALERFDQAQQAFLRLLALDPSFDVGEASPKVRAVFDQAKAAALAAAAFRVEHRPVQTLRPGQPLAVRAQTSKKAASAVIFYRTKYPGSYRTLKMLDVGGNVFVGAIPGKATRGVQRIDYYVEATSAEGGESARAGGPNEPFMVTVTDQAPPAAEEPEVPVPDLDQGP